MNKPNSQDHAELTAIEEARDYEQKTLKHDERRDFIHEAQKESEE